MPIVALAQAAITRGRHDIARDVFAAADQPGLQRDYLLERCTELTGTPPDSTRSSMPSSHRRQHLRSRIKQKRDHLQTELLRFLTRESQVDLAADDCFDVTAARSLQARRSARSPLSGAEEGAYRQRPDARGVARAGLSCSRVDGGGCRRSIGSGTSTATARSTFYGEGERRCVPKT